MIRVTQQLQPEFLDLLRSREFEFQYAYTTHYGDDKPQSITIAVKCSGVSLSDLEILDPWGHFIACPCNDEMLELYTSLPDDINKCII